MNATQCWHLTCIEQQPEGVLRWKGVGRGEGEWGTACNVNGNCVAVAGQHRTDSQSVIQLVSQAALLPTYTHTRMHWHWHWHAQNVTVCMC